MEWEPQLTLLEHRNKKVNVVMGGGVRKIRVEKDIREDEEINVVVPFNLWWQHVTENDENNLELRSRPVTPKRFPEEVKRMDLVLETLIKKLAKGVGPIGVFLPTRGDLSKHLNISPVPEDGGNIALPMPPSCTKQIIRRNGSNSGERRLHLRVPYYWPISAYLPIAEMHSIGEIQLHWHEVTERIGRRHPKKPILLGYSYTGDRYVRVRGLF